MRSTAAPCTATRWPNHDIFHPRAAARDWELIFAMFHRQIPAYLP
jgi:hypothetical protein